MNSDLAVPILISHLSNAKPSIPEIIGHFLRIHRNTVSSPFCVQTDANRIGRVNSSCVYRFIGFITWTDQREWSEKVEKSRTSAQCTRSCEKIGKNSEHFRKFIKNVIFLMNTITNFKFDRISKYSQFMYEKNRNCFEVIDRKLWNPRFFQVQFFLHRNLRSIPLSLPPKCFSSKKFNFARFFLQEVLFCCQPETKP